jgi:hypothetical protein
VVGVATGAPHADHSEALAKALVDRGLDNDRFL